MKKELVKTTSRVYTLDETELEEAVIYYLQERFNECLSGNFTIVFSSPTVISATVTTIDNEVRSEK